MKLRDDGIADEALNAPSKIPADRDDMSIDGLWNKINDPRNRPTPAVVVEAVMYCVRERGLKALTESANVERLARCDAAAKREIEARIAKFKNKGRP